MMQLVLYDHPLDFPNHWVLRAWTIEPGLKDPVAHPMAMLFTDLSRAHALIAREFPNMVLLHGPGADPNPYIYEVYV